MQASELSTDKKLDGPSPLSSTGHSVHGFWKCFWVHAVMSNRESCLFLMQCCWGHEDHAHPVLTLGTPDPLNPLLISYTVDGGIFKVFVILCWGTFFWNCSTNLRCSLLQIGEPLFHKMVKRLSFNIWHVLYVLLGIKYGLVRFSSSVSKCYFLSYFVLYNILSYCIVSNYNVQLNIFPLLHFFVVWHYIAYSK